MYLLILATISKRILRMQFRTADVFQICESALATFDDLESRKRFRKKPPPRLPDYVLIGSEGVIVAPAYQTKIFHDSSIRG